MKQAKDVIKSDKRTPVIDIIGEEEMLNQLAISAGELAVTASKMATVMRHKNIPDDDAEDIRMTFQRSFNNVLLCAEYLGIGFNEFQSMINLYYWHMRLERSGIEKPTEETISKFKDASYMEGQNEE